MLQNADGKTVKEFVLTDGRKIQKVFDIFGRLVAQSSTAPNDPVVGGMMSDDTDTDIQAGRYA